MLNMNGEKERRVRVRRKTSRWQMTPKKMTENNKEDYGMVRDRLHLDLIMLCHSGPQVRASSPARLACVVYDPVFCWINVLL